jgi:hypothetical protein
VIVCLGNNFGGEDSVANDMHAVVGARDVRLELRWTPSDILDACGMPGKSRDTADTAHGLVDHRSVFLPELTGRVWYPERRSRENESGEPGRVLNCWEPSPRDD